MAIGALRSKQGRRPAGRLVPGHTQDVVAQQPRKAVAVAGDEGLGGCARARDQLSAMRASTFN